MASDAPQRRPYKGYRCPFDPGDLPASEVKRRLEGRIAPLDGMICAAWSLQEPDWDKRSAGLKALVPDRGPIREALQDLVMERHAARLEALAPDALQGEIIERLVPMLTTSDGQARAIAANLVGLLGHGHPEVIGILGRLVSDPDADVRRCAVDALKEMGEPEALAPLVRVAHGKDPFLAYEAVFGITAMEGPQARDALVEIVGDSKLNMNVRWAAAVHLRAGNDRVAAAAGERYLESLEPQWQRAFYFGALLYVLAFMASRPESSKTWFRALYAMAVVSIVVLIDPVWLIMGRDKVLFWALAVGYPLGVGIGALPLLWVLKRFGQADIVPLISKRILIAVVMMWGTLALWVVIVFAAMIVGITRAWQ
jgi:hypothetical protein